MSKQLFKQPNMILFWLVLASGVAFIVTDQNNAGGVFATVVRTVFWCSAVAYFSFRIYQFVIRRNSATEAQPGPDEDMRDDA